MNGSKLESPAERVSCLWIMLFLRSRASQRARERRNWAARERMAWECRVRPLEELTGIMIVAHLQHSGGRRRQTKRCHQSRVVARTQVFSIVIQFGNRSKPTCRAGGSAAAEIDLIACCCSATLLVLRPAQHSQARARALKCVRLLICGFPLTHGEHAQAEKMSPPMMSPKGLLTVRSDSQLLH